MKEPKREGILRCICGKCGKKFELTWDGTTPSTAGEPVASIRISSAESCGVYEASVTCPVCGYKHTIL